MINRERLADTFKSLVVIDSPSREEGKVAAAVKARLEALGAKVFFDNAAEKVSGDCGNMIARFEGSGEAPPLLLNAHLDTVEPGRGIEPVFENGVFRSGGETILGADDKSAVAIILEVLQVLEEDRVPHAPLEVVLTVCEELGLLGAKHLDFDLITAPYGYALDATDTEGIVTRAPGANRFEIQIHGKDAHAGAAPEKGINAISLAARAIAALDLGRIDPETTANIGLIEGGLATNIVPSRVSLKGEVRSHNPEKLEAETHKIQAAFVSVVENYAGPRPEEGLPRADIQVEADFHPTFIPEDHRVVTAAVQAARNLGRRLACKTTGGGADANIFFAKGIKVGVLGTGMKDMHTVRESVRLDDMVRAAELLLEIIKVHSTGK